MSTNVVLTSRINNAIDQILNLVTRLKTEYETQRLKRNERTCCLKRNSNLYKLNKHPRISVNARFFRLKKKDAIETGIKLFIVPSFFTSIEDMTNRMFSRWNQKCDST